ncbi:MAG: DUF5666 domain-containing protein [Steroidobacteraceae bacterium]
MNARHFLSVMMLALSSMFVACGGGSDSTTAGINGSGITNGGSSVPGVAVGPITAFGSIFVNGVEFDLSSSTVKVEGISGLNQSDLRIGQVVTVNGGINTTTGRGTATSVEFSDNLQGPVASVNTAASTFTVLGQTVKVTGATVFAGIADLDALAAQPANTVVVEISGFVNNLDQVEATRVEVKTGVGSNGYELTGKVTNLSGVTFTIGSTLIDFTGAQLPNGSPGNNNVCVEVKGGFNGTVFNATSVEVKSCGISATSGLGEIEGIITTVSGNVFSMGSVSVSTASSPRYVNGAASNLIAGTKVEVEGTFNSSGVLMASKIEFKQGTNTRLTGFVDEAPNASAGTFKMFGITVSTTSTTQYVDKLGSSNSSFGLSNIQSGNYLEVRGYENAAHTAMTAVTIERRAASATNRLEIRAFPQAITSPKFDLLTATVNTTAGVTEFRDINGNNISQAAFFSAATANGVMVNARGANQAAWTPGVGLAAERVEIESP